MNHEQVSSYQLGLNLYRLLALAYGEDEARALFEQYGAPVPDSADRTECSAA